jgi:hypothetical protein
MSEVVVDVRVCGSGGFATVPGLVSGLGAGVTVPSSVFFASLQDRQLCVFEHADHVGDNFS